MYAIETKNLTKKYGDVLAVDNLDLRINKGELFALLGMNGAGKTTTIKMLTCLIKPTSGDAFVLGNSVCDNHQAVKQITNVSPQETAVALNLTVKENLEFIAGIYGENKVNAQQTAQEIAERFRLTNVYNKRAKTLSGGMQRRLSIAMALISNPQILFLDEPTLGLDVIARRELWAIITELKKHGTIILTTHYLEEVEALADRVGIMAQGKLVALGTVDELTTQTNTTKFEDAFIKLSGGIL